jgi:hypothetical protein
MAVYSMVYNICTSTHGRLGVARLYELIALWCLEEMLRVWPGSCHGSPGLYLFLTSEAQRAIRVVLMLARRRDGNSFSALPRDVFACILSLLLVPPGGQEQATPWQQSLTVLGGLTRCVFRLVEREVKVLVLQRGPYKFEVKFHENLKSLCDALWEQVGPVHVAVASRILRNELR